MGRPGDIQEDNLIDMLRSLKDGVTEIVSHPGFLSPEILAGHRFYLNCEAELAALVSRRVKMAIEKEAIKLISYGDLITPAAKAVAGIR